MNVAPRMMRLTPLCRRF